MVTIFVTIEKYSIKFFIIFSLFYESSSLNSYNREKKPLIVINVLKKMIYPFGLQWVPSFIQIWGVIYVVGA